jgi:hypothetical protein
VNSEEQVSVIFEHLLTTGAIVLTGMNVYGEPSYRVTEKCAEIFPEFYRVHREEVNSIAYDLWARGLVDISFTEDSEKVTFTEENFKVLQGAYKDLTPDEVNFLTALGAPIDVDITFDD